MITLRSTMIGLLVWITLVFWGHVVGMGGGAVSAATKSIDVVAPGPKFETEPVETNSNICMEADTREKDYTLRPLPTGGPLPRLEFISPVAGDAGHAARITAKVDEAGMLTRTILADKGQRMTFSVKVRAEEIGSVGLVAVPLAASKSAAFGTSPKRIAQAAWCSATTGAGCGRTASPAVPRPGH